MTNEECLALIDEIDKNEEVGLSRWEINFIANLIDNNVRKFSDAQKVKVLEIVKKQRE